MNSIIIRGGTIFAPQNLGKLDIFCIGKNIVKLHNEINHDELSTHLPCSEIINADGCYVIPGFIDQHIHLNGGGGEGGPQYRTPPVQISSLVRSGITSAIGLLGTDGVSRSLEELLMKARGLEKEGISTWILTGSYQVPSPTITGSVMRDIMLIDKVVGLKISLSDHRASFPSFEDIVKSSSEARVGGILSGKAGLITVHMGHGKRALREIFEVINKTDIPITQFVPTHLSRKKELFEQAAEFGQKGGYVDITAGENISNDCVPANAAEAIIDLLNKEVSIDRITVSSDGNGSLPKYDSKGNLLEMGIGSVSGIHETFVDLVKNHSISIEDAVRLSSTNIANHYSLLDKGFIAEGMSADIVILNPDNLSIRHVISKGILFVKDGKLVRKGTFE